MNGLNDKPAIGSILILQQDAMLSMAKAGEPWEVLATEKSLLSNSLLLYLQHLGVTTWLYDWRFRDWEGRLCYKRECVFNEQRT